MAALHPLRMLAAGRLLHGAVANGARTIPVNALHVIVLADTKHRAPLAATVLDDVATATRPHAFTKTMGTFAL